MFPNSTSVHAFLLHRVYESITLYNCWVSFSVVWDVDGFVMICIVCYWFPLMCPVTKRHFVGWVSFRRRLPIDHVGSCWRCLRCVECDIDIPWFVIDLYCFVSNLYLTIVFQTLCENQSVWTVYLWDFFRCWLIVDHDWFSVTDLDIPKTTCSLMLFCYVLLTNR